MTAELDEANLKRDIWVLGFRDSDERPEKALSRVFGIDSVRARRLIASMPAVVKREVTPDQAEPIVAALRRIGARVALVPTGASQPPGRGMSSMPPAAAPGPTAVPPPDEDGEPSDGFGDIESLGIDFGPSGPPPSSGSHAALRDSLPSPRVSSVVPTEPAKISPAPATPEPATPKPISFLEPRAIPEEPEAPPRRRITRERMVGALTSSAGVAAVFFASQLEGSAFGGAPTLAGAALAAGSVALLLFGVQGLVASMVFEVAPLKGSALAVALVVGGAVGATSYFAHHVDPAEAARRERLATMTAIREGRLPEARLFLSDPTAELAGMSRADASTWVEALYEAGARHVYVMIDEADAPEHGTGVTVSLPVTQARRSAVAGVVRQRVPAAPADDGEWWLIPLE